MPSLIELAQMAGAAQGRAAGIEAQRDRNYRMALARKQAEDQKAERLAAQQWQSGEAAAARGFTAGEADKDRAYNVTRDTLARQYQSLEEEKRRAHDEGRDRDARVFQAQQAQLDRQWRSLEAERDRTAQGRAIAASSRGGGGGGAVADLAAAPTASPENAKLWQQARIMAADAASRQNMSTRATGFPSTSTPPSTDQLTMDFYNQLLGRAGRTVVYQGDTGEVTPAKQAELDQERELTLAGIAAGIENARTTAGGKMTAADIAAAVKLEQERLRQNAITGRTNTIETGRNTRFGTEETGKNTRAQLDAETKIKIQGAKTQADYAKIYADYYVAMKKENQDLTDNEIYTNWQSIRRNANPGK